MAPPTTPVGSASGTRSSDRISGIKKTTTAFQPSGSDTSLTSHSLISTKEATNLETFVTNVNKLVVCIITTVNEGKNVTAANKRVIVEAAEEIRRATSTLPISTASPPTSTFACDSDFRREIVACVREEMSKFRHLAAGPSYAQAVSAGGGGRPESHTGRSAPTPPTTRPAIIVATKDETRTKRETIETFRKSANFKNTNYAPVKIEAISNNKLRVEFDNEQQRDDTLSRLQSSKLISAEPARRLRPMIMIKGISVDTPAGELTSVIRRQNVDLEELITEDEDLQLRFKRNNRNSNLYNAVFIAHPKIWRKMVDMGRVSIDHQRVHVDDFSPFLQCMKCLQFGHTQKKCTIQESPCAYCSCPDHRQTDCPEKKKNAMPKCFNCSSHNVKFQTKFETTHKATSPNCPRLRAMKERINNRVDYGSN